MMQNQHLFHIPVMGTGHSIDTPVRVAHLGIPSVISIVDDLLCEKIRKYYCGAHGLPYRNIPRSDPDGRAKRITAYLDTVAEIVGDKFEQLRSMELFAGTEKDRYFRLLPESNPLRRMYDFAASLTDEQKRQEYYDLLTAKMTPGSIDVNIMTKVDALRTSKDGLPLSSEYSDASAALRGFANSSLTSGVVLSAGFNPRLYGYLADFRDFYRDTGGQIRKKIILKVSDFRSALIQGKFLAKKGLEISEFRIESGLNCGGHAFASDGYLLPVLLREFREKKDQLLETFQPLIRQFYETCGWDYPELTEEDITPRITVQGGIGNHGEMQRLLEEYGMDAAGWGSPFLLVPEATCVDDDTMQLLAGAGEQDLYLSGVSPLGVPFNNVRGSGAHRHTADLVENGKPGSKCPKGYLVSNTEFTNEPVCTASAEYQLLKIASIRASDADVGEQEQQIERITEKTCLCTNLGTSSLIRLGILDASYGRQAVCPGPNIAWFTRQYTLDEMVDHIYGRRESLVPAHRPHMFAKELVMYVDYLNQLAAMTGPEDAEWKKLLRMRDNLDAGMDTCLEIASGKAYEGENLASLALEVERQRKRLAEIFDAQGAAV